MVSFDPNRRDPALRTPTHTAPLAPCRALGDPWLRAGALGSSWPAGPRSPRPVRRIGSRVAALALLALAAACTPEIQGNGVFREETRGLPHFVGVASKDPIIVSVTVGPVQSVRVSGDANVVTELETRVRADDARQLPVLELEVTDEFTPVHPLRVDVTVPELQLVVAEDAATVDASGVSSGLLAVEASDGSVVRLAGAGGARLELSLSGGEHGGARVDAASYPVATAAVALTGGARAEVRASGAVTGTAAPGCAVVNLGAGSCLVTDGLGAPVPCSPQ